MNLFGDRFQYTGDGGMFNGEGAFDMEAILNGASIVAGAANITTSTIGNMKHNPLFWRDANGNFKSAKLLKRGANGKYVRGVQGLRNGNNAAKLAAKAATDAGKRFAIAGLFINAADMYANGNYVSNGLNMTMTVVGFVPGVGWMISGAYFVADMTTLVATGKSIGDHAQDWVESW
jgi:hypothetical protein